MTEHARPESEAAAPAAEAASAAAPGGPAKGLEVTSLTDRIAVVKKAEIPFRPFAGMVLTRRVAGYVAAMLWLDFPTLTYEQLVDLVYPPIVRGKLLTMDLIEERARQIACVVVCS